MNTRKLVLVGALAMSIVATGYVANVMPTAIHVADHSGFVVPYSIKK